MFGLISGIKTFTTDFITSFDTSFTTTYNTSHVTTYNTSHVTTYNTSHVTTYTTSFSTAYPVAAYSYGPWGPAYVSYDPPATQILWYGTGTNPAAYKYGVYQGTVLGYTYAYYFYVGNTEYWPNYIKRYFGANASWAVRARSKTLYYYTGYTTTSRSTSHTTTYATSHTTTYATSHTTTYATSHVTTYSTSNVTLRTTSNATSRTTNFYSSV